MVCEATRDFICDSSVMLSILMIIPTRNISVELLRLHLAGCILR